MASRLVFMFAGGLGGLLGATAAAHAGELASAIGGAFGAALCVLAYAAWKENQ
jgi:ammonia channel protein AmtB